MRFVSMLSTPSRQSVLGVVWPALQDVEASAWVYKPPPQPQRHTTAAHPCGNPTHPVARLPTIDSSRPRRLALNIKGIGMSHCLTERADGFVEMAWHGMTPWHKLGQEMRAGASLDEWRQQAGMDWKIQSAPVQFVAGDVVHNVAPHQHLLAPPRSLQTRGFPRRQVLYRSDNQHGLGVVSNRYHAVQPREVLDFFARFMDRQGFAMSAAGTMRKGAVLWATAQTGQNGAMKDGDELSQYVLLSTSCDGSSATEVRLTQVRVVCANTLALARNAAPSVKLPHSMRFNVDNMHKNLAEMELGALQMPFDEFMATARRLAERQVSVQKTQDFLTAVTARMRSGFMASKFDPALCLADQAFEPQTELLQKSDAFTTMLGLFEGAGRGADLRGSRGTAWGLLNAVTEYVDHHNKGNRRQDVSDRYYSAWMGRGKTLKQEALAMAELL